MSTITWLHVSDLHFNTSEYQNWEADIVLNSLLEDIEKQIDAEQLQPDFIAVTGDIAFSGSPQEYDIAISFFNELLKKTGLGKDRFFVVPGNHDVLRSSITAEAKTIISALTTPEKVYHSLANPADSKLIMKKFEGYERFVSSYLDQKIMFDNENYFFVRKLDLNGHNITILGLNTAWMAEGNQNDRGKLALGEHQVRQALRSVYSGDLVIALMHHPFDWLYEFDWECCEALLMEKCDFILRGHLHRTSLLMQITPDAKAFTVAAGACYETRKHKNGYNFIRINTEDRKGVIFLRSWTNSGSGFWTKDIMTYRNLEDGNYPFSLDEYLSTAPPGGDPLNNIIMQFNSHTDRVLNNIDITIPGIAEPLDRNEVALIVDQLNQTRSVVFTGDAGTGKSGICKMLTQSARDKGLICLLIDARQLDHIQNAAQMQEHLGLQGSMYSAIKRIGRNKGCRFIIDQLDNITDLPSASYLTTLVIECSDLEGVEVIVISRKREGHEKTLIENLTKNNFVEINCYPLTETETIQVFNQLGINNPTADLIRLGSNLLNLQLIGQIKQDNTPFDFSSLTDETLLWEKYLQIWQQRESLAHTSQSAELIIAEAVKLAKEGLNSKDRTFLLSYPGTPQQNRLVSGKIIIHMEGRAYRFYHEKLHDFLYAWDATERNLMPKDVFKEISEFRTRNVFLWMEKIYKQRGTEKHLQFLRDTFNG